MNDQSRPDEASLARTIVEQIDQVCDRFEAAWKAGQEPRIEDYLEESDEPKHSALLYQLLLLELDYRGRNDDMPTPDEYLSRFPDHVKTIDSAFREMGTSVALADTVAVTGSDADRRADRATSSESVLKGEKFGRFELIELVARGAFGAVYRAHDPRLDREIALKIPRTGSLVSDEDIERFLREARAAAQLRHSHIVPVHEAGQVENTHYIASDFIPGKTLRAHIQHERRFTHREAATLVATLARALHYAHGKGVVHRDVKPENIVLDADGEPQITDFGLAHREHGETLKTREGIRMGTPAYMSPEQARGQSHLADARSDLWSLGVMLYEFLAGGRPFSGHEGELIVAILETEPSSLRKHDKSIPKDLETICMKCLEKDADRRYQSCQYLAEDLERFCGGEPILARRQSQVVQLCRRIARRPVLSGLIATALLVMILGGFLMKRGLHDRQRAQQDWQVTKLSQNLGDLFNAGDWSPPALETMDNAIAGLEGFALREVERARAELVQSLMSDIEEEFERPALAADDVARIEAWLHVLKQRAPGGKEEEERLRLAFQRRLRTWETVFDLKPPFSDLETVFDPNKVRVDGDALVIADKPSNVDVLYTCVPTPGRTSLEAVFDASWENASVIGLQVNAEEGHLGQPTALAISPNGKTLASGDDRGTVKLWDAESGRVKATLQPSEKAICSLAFSPDSQTLAISGGVVRLWDVATGRMRTRQPQLTQWCDAVAISPDGKTLAASVGGGTTQLWNIEAATQAGTIQGKTRAVTHVAFSPSGEFLAIASLDGAVTLYDASDGTEQRTLPVIAGELQALAFSPDGQTLAIAGTDTSGVVLWNVANGKQRGTYVKQWQVACLAFTADGSRLVTASDEREVGLCNISTGLNRVMSRGPDPLHNSNVLAMAFPPDGHTLFTAHKSRAIVGWNVDTLRTDRTFGSRGYRFLLRARLPGRSIDDKDRVPRQPSFSQLRKTGAPFTLAISRDQTELRREAFTPSRLPPGPLQLKVTKIEDELRFEVGQLPAVSFLDPFAYGDRTPGVFAVQCPAGVRVLQLHGLQQALPSDPSELERGDSLYMQGRFAEALAAYQEQEQAFGSAETAQQARYKAALCLLALQRDSEADASLKDLAAVQGERWPVLATCQLWLRAIRQRQFDAADALFENFVLRSKTGGIEEPTRLLPRELWEEIVHSYSSQSKRLNLYKPNPNLVRHCERAVAVMELFQSSSLSNDLRQTMSSLIRAYRAVGQETEALQIAANMLEDGRFRELPGVASEYAWMLRLAGRPDQALAELDRWISRTPEGAYPSPDVILERVRVLAALQRWDDAEKTLKELLRTYVPGNYRWRTMRWEYTSACALLGFLRQRRGDTAGAKEAWKEGLRADWMDPRFGFRCVQGLILASLTGELSESDTEAFVSALVGTDSPLIRFGGGLLQSEIGPRTLTPVLRDSFRSPRGREYARKIVFREIPFAECIRVAPVLILSEFIRQGAMPEELTDEQEDVVWKVADESYTAVFETGTVDALKMGQLYLAWKGKTLGWDFVDPNLDPQLRGPIAYVLGHRYVRKWPENAAKFFQAAIEDAPADTSLRTLAQAELNRLAGDTETPHSVEETSP